MAALPPGVDPSQVPVQPNPSGAPPNFTDPPTLGPAIAGIGMTMLVITAAVVSARIYTNLKGSRKLGWDDYSCLLALFLTIGYTSVVISNQRILRHAWDIPLSFLLEESFVKKNFVLGVMVGPSIFFAKASIFLLYLRLFGGVRWMRYTVWCSLILLFCTTWVTVPLHSVYCTPHRGESWNMAILPRCEKIAVVGIPQGALGIFFDILIFVLPLPIIFNLNMKQEAKIKLAAVFMVGFLATISSAMALFYRVKLWRQDDGIWNAAKANLCIIVETWVAILVSCTPAVSSFWRNYLSQSRLFSSLWSQMQSARWKRSSARTSDKDHAYPSDDPSLESTSQQKVAGGYLELHDQKPQTVIHSNGSYPPPPKSHQMPRSIVVNQSLWQESRYT